MILKRLILALLMIVVINDIYAIEGELVPQANRTLDLEEGSLFDGVLRIWPVSEEAGAQALAEYTGKNLGEVFNLVRVDEIAPSSHNAEVLELRGLFALIKAGSPRAKLVIKLMGQDVQIEVRRLNMIATAPPAQNFELVEQPEMSTFFEKTSPVTLAFSGGFVFILLLLGITKIREQQAVKRKRVQAKEEIAKAKSRDEIERIGRKIEHHQFTLSLSRDKVDEFKKQLDQYQYRPTWTDEQLAQVRKSLESLIE